MEVPRSPSGPGCLGGHAALAGYAANVIDDIVGGESCGLIQDKDGIDHSSLWSSKACRRSTFWEREMPYDVSSSRQTKIRREQTHHDSTER